MSEITERYYPDPHIPMKMCKSPIGSWVKYEHHEEAIAKARQEGREENRCSHGKLLHQTYCHECSMKSQEDELEAQSPAPSASLEERARSNEWMVRRSIRDNGYSPLLIEDLFFRALTTLEEEVREKEHERIFAILHFLLEREEAEDIIKAIREGGRE